MIIMTRVKYKLPREPGPQVTSAEAPSIISWEHNYLENSKESSVSDDKAHSTC